MKQTLTNSELSVFSQQLAMILHSGISALEGVSILRDDTPEGEGRDILSRIYESLELTGDLHQSLLESEVFPEYFVKMTELGERSGTLEDVMTALSNHYARQDALMRSIRDALVYPVVLLGMLLAVLIVLMTRVMPVFSEVFQQLGIEITGVSGAVFRVGNILQKISVGLLILLAAAAFGCLIAMRTRKGRDLLTGILLHIPLGKQVSEMMDCSRFCNALALALHSGLDMTEGFELAAGLCQQETFHQKAILAEESLNQGMDLAEALRDSKIITGLNARMVSIGFHTGTAETALNRIATECQEDADRRVQAATGALEPTLTAILSILTGIILVSVMLPLLGVMANIG